MTIWSAFAVISGFVLGLYVCVRATASVQGIVDSWYRIGDLWLPVVRNITIWCGLAWAGLTLPSGALGWGFVIGFITYIGLVALGQIAISQVAQMDPRAINAIE